jgi:hypothetical protein
MFPGMFPVFDCNFKLLYITSNIYYFVWTESK